MGKRFCLAMITTLMLWMPTWVARGEGVMVKDMALKDLAALEAAAKEGKNAEALQPLVAALFASARQVGTPFGKGESATFLHFGPAKEASAHGVFRLDDGDGSVTLQRIGSLDVWVGRVDGIPEDAEFLYKMRVDEKMIADPLCKEGMEGFGPNSVGRMPANVPPPEMKFDAKIPHGQVETFEVESKVLKNVRRVWVYLPSQYAKGRKHYPVLYVQDGDVSLSDGRFDRIADALLAKKAIQPVIMCLIPPVNRVGEYWFDDKSYAQFITDEMVPLIDERYRTLRKPENRGITGASLGGRISTYIASARPDMFGICAGQSSYFEKDSKVIEQLREKPNLAVRFYYDVGIFERGVARNFGNDFSRDLLMVNRELRDLLQAQGHKPEYREWPAGHCMLTWGRGMAAALQLMWPGPNAAPEGGKAKMTAER